MLTKPEWAKRSSLVDAYGAWIGDHNWDHYLTATYGAPGIAATHRRPGARFYWNQGDRPPAQRAKQTFNYFFKHLNSPNGVFYHDRIRCFFLFERLPHPHIHAFIKGIDPQLAEALEHKCRQFFGDSKVVPYDSSKGARFYLGGKCVGREDVYWDVPYTVNSKYRSES